MNAITERAGKRAETYPEFAGDDEAEILWLQGKLMAALHQNNYLLEARRLQGRVQEDVWALINCHKEQAEDRRERVVALELGMARLMAALSSRGRTPAQQVAWNEALCVLDPQLAAGKV